MRRTASLLLLAFVFWSLSATSQQSDIATKLVGAWKLVSVTGDPVGLPGFYHQPTGLLIYLDSGQMAVQIAARSDRKPFGHFNSERRAASTSDRAAAFDSYNAYYGTYTVDSATGTVTHHLQDSIMPGLQGIQNVRWFEFQGEDTLVLIPVEDGKGGRIDRKTATFKLIWERLK